ncbi:recombination-associated protein RdgC [Rhodocyclus tenuis]|uniref:recombination-associated protein RdgC n=1 Tax=Rhodocyclus gracilis TaxID=2929842 RepID=UPI0012989040|nr:recombination-associated protein RdgC [Rhodocyclus gracilis]MRD73984.1 recombination-associated protein RdgC [Rhodocyclus gracilis]
MWFKNLQIFRLSTDAPLSAAVVAEQLAQRPLNACSALDAQSFGFTPPRDGGDLVHVVNGQWLLALGVEQKLLPGSVVTQFAKDRAREIAENEGRKVGRKEMRELKERITEELLPRAFVRRRTTFAWIDPKNGWLVVDASAPAKAEEFLEALHKTLEALPVKPLRLARSPVAAMTGWVAGNEAPAGFSIDQDLELRSPEKATVRYARHSLDGDEIRAHIANGKTVTRLGMTWNDRISFQFGESGAIKRLAFLDVLKDENETDAANDDERFDLDFALMSGELARLLDDVIEAVGGEVVGETMSAAVATQEGAGKVA